MPKIADLTKLRALGFHDLVPLEPGKKSPVAKKWQAKQFLDSDFTPGCNVGVLLGQQFVDVDIDDDRLLRLAPHILPPTGCRWGRYSRRASHWLYRTAGKTQRFKVPEGEMLVEYRSGAHCTMAPGSIHPDGEAIRFDAEGEPSECDARELLNCVKVLALSAVVLEIWTSGNHHFPALAAAGVMAKAGIDQNLALRAMRALSSLPSGGELKDLEGCVRGTYSRHANGDAVAGLSRLADCGLSKAAVEVLGKWFPSAALTDSEAPDLDCAAPNWRALATNVGDYGKKVFAPKDAVLQPWLKQGDAVLLYGLPGHAKTLTALAIADAISRGSGFGGCSAPKARRALYFDGELGGAGLQDLLGKLNVCPNVQLVPSSDLLGGEGVPNIADAQQQGAIIALIKEGGAEVVIFDNVFCLAVIEDINSNSDKGIISLQRFAARLRNLGITSIFVHHATKASKGFTGATRLEVAMDLTVQVKRDGQRLELTFQKHRGRRQPEPIDLQIEDDSDGLRLKTPGLITLGNSKQYDERRVLKCLSEGMSIRRATADLKWSKDKVPRVLKACVAAGFAKKKSDGSNAPYVLTDAGKQLLGDAEELDGDNAVAML